MASKAAYSNFLLMVLLNKVVDSKTISLWCSSSSLGTYYKNQALEKNHIRKTQSIVKTSYRTKTTATVYSITRKGVQFVLENSTPLKSAIGLYGENFFVPEETLPLYEEGDRQQRKKYRLAYLAKATVLADKIGARINKASFVSNTRYDIEEDQKEAPSMIEYIRRAIIETEFDLQCMFPSSSKDNGLEYTGATAVKINAGNYGISDVKDYFAGRYAGVLDSKQKSILIYLASASMLEWNSWAEERDKPAYVIWRKTKAAADPTALMKSGECAAILFDFPNQLKRFYDSYSRAKRETRSAAIKFDHLYCSEASEQGANHINWISQTDDEAEQAAIAEDAVSTGPFYKNEEATSSLFPLLNAALIKCALGFHFDFIEVFKIIEYAERSKGETFELLCYDWQAKYYTAILPNNIKLIRYS